MCKKTATVVVLIVLATLCGVAVSSADEARPDTRPNVLFVLTDDMTPNMMSAMPDTKAWLRHNFTNAIAQTPLCCPSRASILSGKHVHNNKVKTLDLAYSLNFNQTFPKRLSDSGYNTAVAGKIMNSWRVGDVPSKMGFQRWAAMGGGYGRVPLHTDPETDLYGVTGPGQKAPVTQIKTLTDASRKWLSDWERDDAKPWMMYLATTAPHTPYGISCTDRPAPDMPITPAFGEKDFADKPAHTRDRSRQLFTWRVLNDKWKKAWLTLSCVDKMLMNIKSDLAAKGELDNTLVIFTSDNGYMFGEHHLFGKREAYDPSLRVPMRMSWPAGDARFHHKDRIAAMIDIAPTMLDVAGVSHGYTIDGRSLFGNGLRKRILIEHFAGGSFAQAVPTWAGWWSPGSMYRRIWYTGAEAKYQTGGVRVVEEKYDGPHQLTNLLHNKSSRVDRDWVSKARVCSGSTCRWLEGKTE